MDDDDFNIPYILYIIPNLQEDHRLISQANNNTWIVETDREDPINAEGAPEEIQKHHYNKGKHKLRIKFFQKQYQLI